MLRRAYSLTKVILLIFIIAVFALPGFAQEEQPTPDVAILESRFSTTTPVVGDTFKYFLKFDYLVHLDLYPVEHLSEQGLAIIEIQELEAQEFDGRIIRQYEYTLEAKQAGQYQFSPITVNFTGPRQNAIAALADPAQLTVSSIVDVQVTTNSPVMLGESLELSLTITKRKPVSITAIPHELEAAVPAPKPFELLEQTSNADVSSDSVVTPSPTPQPLPLHFALDQSQTIVPQQVDGATVEQYQYILSAQPEHAGEYVIPAFTMTYRKASGEELQQSVEESKIFVLNPNTGNLDIQTDYRFLIFPGIIVITLVLGGVLVLLYLKYRKSRKDQETFIPPPLPPGEVAHQELTEIQAMKLPAKGEFKQYYILVSESVRKFLGAEYHFHVLERTTEEILGEIHQRDIPANIRQRVSTFLPEADMVKFAKYTPTIEQADSTMEQALHIVDDSLEYHRPKVLTEETEVLPNDNSET